MKLRRKSIISFLLGLVIIAVLLYFSDLGRIYTIISNMNYFLIVVGLSLFLISVLLRGFRFKYVIGSLKGEISFRLSINSVFASILVNLIIPAKLGEIVRVYILKKKGIMRVSRGLVSTGLDRFSDLIGILVLAVISFFFASFYMEFPAWISSTLLVGAVVVLSGIFAVFFFGRCVIKKISETSVFFHFFQGLREVSNFRILTWSTLFALGIWVLEGISAYYIFLSLGLSGFFFVVIFAVMVGYIVTTIPLTPAGLGIYEGAVAAVLVAVGINFEIALTFALMEHLLKNFLSFLMGIYSVYYLGTGVITRSMEHLGDIKNVRSRKI